MTTVSSAEASPAGTEVRPGQLWRWKFDIPWFMTSVTHRGRTELTMGVGRLMRQNSLFTVVSLDDPGPAAVPVLPWTMEDGILTVTYASPKRWHVVLFDGVMVWFDHSWFEQAELLIDAV